VSHQRGRTIIDYQLDRHIIESWRRHEQAEPHISTERLMDGHGARRYQSPGDCQIEPLAESLASLSEALSRAILKELSDKET
jgi:hypothetical protein